MNIPTCPHCGALIPKDTPFRGSPVKQRIFEYIAKHPHCEMPDIADYVYANASNGGADMRTLNTLICQMRPILASVGLAIENKRGPGARYRLVQKATA